MRDAEILEAARANKIPSSKWVLFPSLRQVDRAWGIVAESIARGQLGIGAKVATDGGGSGFGDEQIETLQSGQKCKNV
ncbi:hypothetical protein I7I51_04240 [Histoplasma capsulatum]|uniref:Uncharacterized protein n=1 Tax=Ajellomyces capsulatus TaxID=5037 RepID=A0A8A1MBG8_AJECA|nr:hypothetical protein I7I51_04240 [Histoplasma capsulatum]